MFTKASNCQFHCQKKMKEETLVVGYVFDPKTHARTRENTPKGARTSESVYAFSV